MAKKKAAPRKRVARDEADHLTITIEKLGKPITWTIPAAHFEDLPRAQRNAFLVGVHTRVRMVIENRPDADDTALAGEATHTPVTFEAFLLGYREAKVQA